MPLYSTATINGNVQTKMLMARFWVHLRPIECKLDTIDLVTILLQNYFRSESLSAANIQDEDNEILTNFSEYHFILSKLNRHII